LVIGRDIAIEPSLLFQKAISPPNEKRADFEE
jgi:hypothetical protein